MTLENAAFLRTLYIQEQGTVLRVENERFRVTGGDEDGEEIINVPAIKVGQIVIFGACMITPAALRFCLINRIPIVLLSGRGKYFSRIESTDDVNVVLERIQFKRSTDPEFQLQCGKHFVKAKLHNCAVLLRRHGENNGSKRLQGVIKQMLKLEKMVEDADSLDAVRGYEGRGASIYFGVFEDLFGADGFCFTKRVRRPPTDQVNAMLSFGYSLLFNNIFSMVRIHRLHPYVGFLHADKSPHPTMVSDLIEEFRCVIDGMVIGIINKHIISPDDFALVKRSNGKVKGCYLDDTARKTYLREFENMMHRKTTHTATGYRVSYRRCLDLQVQEFALFLKGEKEYVAYRRR